MVAISFEINGKKVNAHNLKSALEKAVLNGVQESIKKRVGAARCPEHGSGPQIVCRGKTLDALSFEVSGCCQKLIESVQAKLK